MTDWNERWWLEVQRDVMAAREAPQPLARGEYVAWVERIAEGPHSTARTKGVSLLHRAFENGETYCLLPIPNDSRRLDLGLLKRHRRCYTCEELHARQADFRQVAEYAQREIDNATQGAA